MIDWSNSWVIAGASAAGVLLLALGGVLFQAGCALANVTEPKYLKSLALFAVALAVWAPLDAWLLWYAGSLDPASSWMGPYRVTAVAAALLVTWAGSAEFFALALRTSYRKGLIIAGTVLVLAALVAALIALVVMVVLAVVQIANPSSQAGGGAPPAAVVRARLP
jgi:hypothetical protein